SSGPELPLKSVRNQCSSAPESVFKSVRKTQLMRIRAMYAVDTVVMKAPPSKRAALRQERVLPLMNDFFEWVRTEAQAQTGRSLAATALGYAVNQEQELRAVLQDVHLPLDNTRSERA